MGDLSLPSSGFSMILELQQIPSGDSGVPLMLRAGGPTFQMGYRLCASRHHNLNSKLAKI